MPTPIENTKYVAIVQSEIRNSNGILAGIGESDIISVLPHSITDDFLDSFPVVEKIVRDGVTYEKIIVIDNFYSEDDRFKGQAVLISEISDEEIILFSALTHGYTVEMGDQITHTWTILRQIT